MYLLGHQLVGDLLSVALTPTDANNLRTVTLQNGKYDDLSLTYDTETPVSDEIPRNWGLQTIMIAGFEGTANAGSVDFVISNTSHILVKRRKSNSEGEDNPWITLEVKEVESADDINLNGIDFLNASSTSYDYAFVPVNDGAEGGYIINTVFSEFDGIFIMEKDEWWGTPITNGNIDTTRVIERSLNTMYNSPHPTTVTRSITNYDSGTVVAAWYPFDEDSCLFISDDLSRTPYQRKFMDFLTNQQPKILKHFDGRMWLIDVAPSPSDSAVSGYDDRDVSFSWDEIGDYRKESDLYYANLTDVEERWWSEH